jgi:adenylosuccinate lyase
MDILGLKTIDIATQVLPRDNYAALLSAYALMACCIEHLASEIRHLHRTEVAEVCEGFGAEQKGSSSMPHKKNPIMCERMCGLARMMRSYVNPAMEDINLWHERDISHSSVERLVLPQANIVLYYMLKKTKDIVLGLTVNTERMFMRISESGGEIFSQRLMLSLLECGMDKNECYALVQKLAFSGRNFESAVRDNDIVARFMNKDGIDDVFSVSRYVKNVDFIFSRFLSTLNTKYIGAK